MPRGDRTGPAGAGPMTGRGAGYCAGYGMPGFANYGAGWGGGGGGFGRGRGRGFGFRGRGWGGYGFPQWGNFWGATPGVAPAMPDASQEADLLKAQSEQLEATLQSIRKRIDELEGESK